MSDDWPLLVINMVILCLAEAIEFISVVHIAVSGV